MKKIFVFFAVIMVLLPMVSIGVVAAENDTAPVLDAELEQAMKTAYWNQYMSGGEYEDFTENDLQFQYFGAYDGCQVVIAQGPFDYPAVETSEVIAGLEFVYPTIPCLNVYRDGSFLPLSEAWEADWLSFESLKRLHTYYGSGIWVPDTGDSIAPDANADSDMRRKISDAWTAQNGSGLNWDGQALYYGIVGDCGIFLLNGPIAEESTIEVAGYSFLHSGSFQIYAFDGEDFFTLKEAYGSGLLTAVDIGDIYHMHNKTPNTGDTVATVACVMVLSLATAAILVCRRKRFAD